MTTERLNNTSFDFKKDSLILFFFSLMFILPTVISELLFGGSTPATFWYMRIIDIIDITIITAVYIAFLLYVKIKSVELTGNRFYINLFFVVSLLFIGAHFMHFAANSVNTYAYEARGYQFGVDIREDVAKLLYFLDEDLSHLILFPSLIFVMFLAVISRIEIYSSTSIEENLQTGKYLLLNVFTSLLYGTSMTISAIEARKPYFVISIILVILLGIIYISKQYNESLKDLIKKDSFVMVFTLLFVFSLVLFAVYYLVFGSFVEPSKLIRSRSY